MTVPESVLVALFIIALVFSVLVALSLIIKIFSKGLNAVSKIGKTETKEKMIQTKAASEIAVGNTGGDFSTGTLRLKNVDEPTAAMIMAIVSDESGIPLSELCFKSIKLMNKE